jgi:hypothetical protein
MRVAGKPRTSFITSTARRRVPAVEAGRRPPRRRPPARRACSRTTTRKAARLGERCLMSVRLQLRPGDAAAAATIRTISSCRPRPSSAIWVEMVHDVRHIRIGGEHRKGRRAHLDGRQRRPLGGQHPGRRDHQLLAQQAFRGADENLKGHRALHPRLADPHPLSVHRRGPDRLGQALGRRIRVRHRQGQPLRIRLPRGQLRASEGILAGRAGRGSQRRASKRRRSRGSATVTLSPSHSHARAGPSPLPPGEGAETTPSPVGR